MDRRPPQRGDVLDGKYRIERELGRGGMGIVYQVQHVVMPSTRYALKWLITSDSSQDAAIRLRRLRSEARITATLRHPHVIRVYDVTTDETGGYLVMELLEGENLSERIRRQGALRSSDAVMIAVACLDGLSAAHASGIVHRDLKPANVFLHVEAGAKVVPKLLDFGVSRTLSASDTWDVSDASHRAVGSPAYIAPEQLRSEPCGIRTDIYGVGVTLYEALAGTRAFHADDLASLYMKVVTGDTRALTRLRPELPRGLARVVGRAMHVHQRYRYASAAELKCALEPYTRDTAELATSRRLRRRLAWLTATAATGAVSWLGANSLGMGDNRSAKPPAITAANRAAPPSALEGLATVDTAPRDPNSDEALQPHERPPANPVPKSAKRSQRRARQSRSTGTEQPAPPNSHESTAAPLPAAARELTPVLPVVPAVSPSTEKRVPKLDHW